MAVEVHYVVNDYLRARQQTMWCHRAALARAGSPEWLAAMDRLLRSVQVEEGHAKVSVALSTVAALSGLTAAFMMGNRVARGTRRLARAARALAVGDYRRRISIRTGDELESLGESFNLLGESLLKHEEASRERAELLGGMVEAASVASASLDVKQCGRAIATAVCTHLGAADAAVYRRDPVGGGMTVIGKRGARHGADWARLAVHAADSGEYLVVAEHDCGRNGRGEALLISAPLATGSESLGSVVARYGEGLSRDDLKLGSLRSDVFRAFAIHAATAVANAEVLSRTAQYSEALEDWVEHVSALMQVTEGIARSLNLDDALEALAKATASVMAVDECVIFLPDATGGISMRTCFASGERREGLHYTRLLPGQSASGMAFAEKRCVSCFDAKNSDDEQTRVLSTPDQLGGILAAPLIVGEEAIGVISLYCFTPREFSWKETQLLTSIALHAAVVVRNAKLYTTEATIAETLQRSLVSEAPEQCRGLQFAGRYVPALAEASVGGDFYDVTPLPDGTVAVAIADVSGKGLGAAIHLAACKYMLKSLVYVHPGDPATVLGELNDAINYCFQQDFFVTVFHAVIDPVQNTIVYASAGHPPPLLITENWRMHTRLPSTGIPLGAGQPCRYENQSVKVKPGDVLLLYTDGVTDAVKGGARLEIEGLHDMVFEAGRCSNAELVDHLLDMLSKDTDSSRKDDVALLAVSFGAVTAAPEMPGGKSHDGERHITAGTQ